MSAGFFDGNQDNGLRLPERFDHIFYNVRVSERRTVQATPVAVKARQARSRHSGYVCCSMAATALASQKLSPMNFLLVDDNRRLTQCIGKFLREKGHRSSSLSDSSKVLGWLGRHPCDALVLDIRMPKIGGIALTKMVREKHGAIPILMLTGLGYDDEFIQAAIEAGANGYVSKVMGPSIILMSLLRIVGVVPPLASGKAA